jgi:triphosphoribosyl-dephospho-CoA synthetase
LSAENVRVFVAEDPLNSQLEVVVNEVRALILEASRENRADRVQKSFDFLQSAVALDVTFSGLNNKLADGAVLARLGRLDGLDELGRAAQTELRANNAGSLLLEQELNQSLAFLGNEVVAFLLESAGEEVADCRNKSDDFGFSGVAGKEVFGVVSNKLAHRARLAGLSGLSQGRTEAQEHGKNNKGSSHLNCGPGAIRVYSGFYLINSVVLLLG